MNTAEFIKRLKGLSFENTFNPYRDRCDVYDLCDAPKRRSEILLALLNAALDRAESDRGIDSMWVGLALGHLGGRRTGLALTDDVHFDEHLKRWELSFERPTQGQVEEKTAKTVWEVLSQIETLVFLWNVFPLHPHEPYNPCSNRDLKAAERETGEKFLAKLIRSLRPRRLIAIGNDAYDTIHRLFPRYEVVKVPHPSRRKIQFLRQMQELYPSATCLE